MFIAGPTRSAAMAAAVGGPSGIYSTVDTASAEAAGASPS
jgi:hypothetical protein